MNASYESLEKFYKSNLETLRIPDTTSTTAAGIVVQNNYKLDYCDRRPQPATDEDPERRRNAAVPPRPTMAVEESVYETLDEAVSSEKQRQLSDWYYIKTSPKPRQWNNEWRNKNGKVDYLEQYPLKSSSSASHFPATTEEESSSVVAPGNDENRAFSNGVVGRRRDPRRLPHPPEIDVQSSRMYQNLVLNRVHSLPRQEDNSAPSAASSSSVKHGGFDPQPMFVGNSTFIQSESNLKDFHFYENLIEQKMNRVPPPAFGPQSPVSMNVVGTTTATVTNAASSDVSKVRISQTFIVNE